MPQPFQGARLFEDSTNLFLIVLKFLLVIVIGLRGSLLQVGFDPTKRAGVVNATPASQVTSSTLGEFRVSFYTVFYSAGVSSKADQYLHIVTPWRCEGDCPAGAFKEVGSCPEGGPDWVRLQSHQFRPLPLVQQKSPLREVTFKLSRGADDARFVAGKYSMVYHVRLQGHDEAFDYCLRSDDGSAFEVIYQPDDEGEWRVSPIEIVQGRGTDVPEELRGSALSVAPDTGLRLSSGTIRVGDRRLYFQSSFERSISIETRVAEIDPETFTFTTANQGGQRASEPISAADARFLRYSSERGRLLRSEFRDLKVGYRVQCDINPETREATVVRFGDELNAIVPVVVTPNLAPRAIYIEPGKEKEQSVLLYFPLHAYHAPISEQRFEWYFNLNRYIIDPDGRQGGKTSVYLPLRAFTPVGSVPSFLQLKEDPKTHGTLLTVDPRLGAGRRSAKFQLRVSDDWSSTVIAVEVLFMTPDSIETLVPIARQIRGD